ncbi:ephrin type-B receptor 1-B-like [Rhopilema esculentum]|uniref:ephrin type-B receptor 1-B-like n=1 Tax=Rhopilema esculentum TaxID=499914 RepID=UPI0031E3A59B
MDIKWNWHPILGLVLLTLSCIVNVTNGIEVPVSLTGLEHWRIVKNGTISSVRNNWKLKTDETGFTACELDNNVVDGYVITPFVITNPAKQITLRITYTLNCCLTKLSIGVYVLLGSGEISAPSAESFKYISALKNTTSMNPSSRVQFKSVFTIGMEGRTGLFIAFRDQGICGRLDSFQLSYIECPSSAGEFMSFPPKTPAPNSTVSVLKVIGTCAPNADVQISQATNYMFCYTNGSTKVNGGCRCIAGYENHSFTSCNECPAKSFKSVAGNFNCTRCGANVEDGLKPRTTPCKCNNGYYRPLRSKSVPTVDCEAPPSAPKNVKATQIGSKWILLEWMVPMDRGSGDKPSYTIKASCTKCKIPPDFTTPNLLFNVTGLSAYTRYDVRVYSINNVTAAIGFDKAQYNSTLVLTGSGLPSEVQNLTKRTNSDGSVTIFWNEPLTKGGDDLRYFVTVNGEKGMFTTKLKYTVKQEQETKKYTVSVKSHTSAGFSKEEVISFEIKGKGISLTLVIAVVVTLFILLLIAGAFVVYFYRRRHPKHLQPVRLENGEVILPSGKGVQVYIDPTTYQDLEDAVQQFANELDRSWIKLDRLIGGGEFGDVYKGTMEKPSEKAQIVAVKTLKSNANKKARDDFLGEAMYMGQFDDPNVINLEGVVVKDRPILIVIEFMSNGSLDSFLQENDGKFTPLQLLGMARGVASGMKYLSEMSYIHRDLAARNILVNDDMVCKVADFGMSRELSEEDTYNTTGGKIPARWTAPEAIQFKKFTIASDVWSYGILLWEIMSYGERPYWDWGNYEVLERLASGYRLPPPMSCPKVVHDLMLSCWHKDRVKRPKFKDIRGTIDKWIRSPELLKHEESVVTRRDTNLDYASMKTLKEWLDSIGMSRYIENFTKKGLVTPRQILELTDPDLKDIGIEAVGHRNKIMKNINLTKGQLIRTKSMAI